MLQSLQEASQLTRNARQLQALATTGMASGGGRAAGKAAGGGVIQRAPLTAKVKLNGTGEITSASMAGDRPPGNLRGHDGDHTTPYVSFLHIAINNVLGKNLSDAVENLKLAMERIKEFPGYANASSYVRKPLDTHADFWIDWADNAMAPTTSEVEQMMVAVVQLRNAVPMSAYLNRVSTGGNNEANTAGGLHYAERLARAGNGGSIKGNPLVNVFQTFDWAAPGSRTNEEWGALLTQHIRSIRESYPYLFEIGGLYTLDDMRDYLIKTELPNQFGKVTAADIAKHLS